MIFYCLEQQLDHLMLVEIFKGYWTLNNVKERHDYIFIFGDNDIENGTGGQATIRGQPNAMGIPTTKTPDVHYTDAEYLDNVKKIKASICKIKCVLKSGEFNKVVFSSGGLGTDIAQLKEHAPFTFAKLNQLVDELKKYITSLPQK